MTELMRLFEDRRTGIFLYDPNRQVKGPAGGFGDDEIGGCFIKRDCSQCDDCSFVCGGCRL